MNFQSIDAQILLLINHGTANSLFDVLMPFLSRDGYLLSLPFLAFMIIRGWQKTDEQNKRHLAIALWAIAIAVCSYFLVVQVETILKLGVGRMRACRAVEGIRLIVACPNSFSFPSGHSITSFGVAVPLFYLSRTFIPFMWRLYPLILASLIAFSRLYLGVHYPTDVLTGVFLGTIIGLALSMSYEVIVKMVDGKKKD